MTDSLPLSAAQAQLLQQLQLQLQPLLESIVRELPDRLEQFSQAEELLEPKVRQFGSQTLQQWAQQARETQKKSIAPAVKNP